jgi:ABC-type nitrate/sulfonate/bicarbonate transport system permease component
MTIGVKDKTASRMFPTFRLRLHVKPSVWRKLLSLALAAALWEFLATYVIQNRLFFAPLSAVIVKIYSMWAEGTLQTDLLASSQTFGLDFVVGSVAAIALGVLMALSDWVRDLVDPWVSAMYATPFIALAPLLPCGSGSVLPRMRRWSSLAFSFRC